MSTLTTERLTDATGLVACQRVSQNQAGRVFVSTSPKLHLLKPGVTGTACGRYSLDRIVDDELPFKNCTTKDGICANCASWWSRRGDKIDRKALVAAVQRLLAGEPAGV
jgi:hypothetical protein